MKTTKAKELSQKYGIPWFNAEFLVSGDEGPGGMGSIADPLPIEDYYKAGLSAFNKYGGSASGFTIHSLLGSGKVYDTPAFPLIKSFFAGR